MSTDLYDGEIWGVQIKDLVSHPDQRGFFREVFRATEGIFDGGVFGQWSHSRMEKDVVKAWHYHHVQTDWWYVPIGVVRTVLVDFREECPTFRAKMEILMGTASDARAVCVRIPPGVLHGCRVITEEAHLFYITSETYDQNEEGRFPYNAKEVGYDWGSNCIVSEKDKRYFTPTRARERLVKLAS